MPETTSKPTAPPAEPAPIKPVSPSVQPGAKADDKTAQAIHEAPTSPDAPPSKTVIVSQPGEAEKADKTAPPAEPAPILRWFQCRTPTHVGALNVLAKDADAARERFKKAMGIRSTPHDITITELLPDFTPSEKDKELESLIDKNDSPPN